MHLLYLDDAGSAKNQNEEYFVLGGVSVFEAQTEWFTHKLDRLASGMCASDLEEVEFHASEIFGRRIDPWRGRTKEDAIGIIKGVLRVLEGSYDTTRLFACAVHKASFPGEDTVELAFEDICSRFNLFLNRISREGDIQRGILILDESAHETTLQQMAQDFRTLGTRWGGTTRHIAEIPLFVNSKACRLIQLADHVAYAVFRRYNAGDINYFDIIAGRFDNEGGTIHGLAHKQRNQPDCTCPACMSRRLSKKE
jgi:hypothetical protein